MYNVHEGCVTGVQAHLARHALDQSEVSIEVSLPIRGKYQCHVTSCPPITAHLEQRLRGVQPGDAAQACARRSLLDLENEDLLTDKRPNFII